MSSDISLEDLICSYAAIRPEAVPTLRSVFKLIAPWAWKRFQPPIDGFDARFAAVPARELYGLFAEGRRSWRDDIAARLPPGTSYQKAYVGFVRRLVVYGEDVGLLHPDHYLISPAWRAVLSAAETHLVGPTPRHRTGQRSALRRLARWATAAGIEPGSMPVIDEEGRSMAAFKATFTAERDGDFFRARQVWNSVVVKRCQPAWLPWPAEPTSPFSALPESMWPAIVRKGFEMLLAQEEFGEWSAETRAGYRHRLGSYLGVLERQGHALVALLAHARDGKDAFRILFQGLPAGTSSPMDEGGIAARLADPSEGAGLVSELRAYEGRFEGRACAPNPFVVSVASEMAGAGYLTTARDLFLKARAINQGMLGITARHTAWCGKRLKQLDERARRVPTAYARKKRAVFRTPMLWPRLVAVRPTIRLETSRMEDAYRGAGGTSKVQWQRRWAVALRNEVLFGLLLCYPLRARNLIEMRLGENYDAAGHRIYFPPEATKNGREVDYELPDGGVMGDVRGLMALYLDEARPALLAGRSSAYVFVPDPRGGSRLRAKAVNDILAELSRRYLVEVLPAGVSALNPHLVRHAVATYHVAIGRDVNLAAQLLNDSPSTIGQAYADVLESKKEATKTFLSKFTL